MCHPARNRRFAAARPAREFIEEENPAAPRVDLTEDNQSLINSIRSAAALTPQERETCLQSLFNLMTEGGEEAEAQFREVKLALEENHFARMASLLTSNSDRFLEIARYKTGSYRLQALLGKSADVDIFFFDAILCRFVDVMTDKNPYHVALEGMQVFSKERREAMVALTVFHAVRLARDRYGCVALKKIIDGLSDRFYRDEILDKVASNALSLSDDVYGNFVVQDVLELYGVNNARKVASKLKGHCVELSLTVYGRHVVGRLLEKVETTLMVVADLLECEQDKLMMLATNWYGTLVVRTALRATQDESINRLDLFWRLVNKLWPLYPHLRMTHHGRTIAEFLESINYY